MKKMHKTRKTFKKLIDSQESPSCRGKNNILRRDLDIFKKCMQKECKLEVNKDNRQSNRLKENIICLNEFKKFQFETELAYQTESLRQVLNVDKKYASLSSDDRDQIFKRLTLQIRQKLLEKFNVPKSKWKEMFINEPDEYEIQQTKNNIDKNYVESASQNSNMDLSIEFEDDQSFSDKRSISNSIHSSIKAESAEEAKNVIFRFDF